MRLIAIVLGEETAAIRNQETAELLDYGFNNKKIKILKTKNETIKKISLQKATVKTIKIKLKEDLTILSDKGINNNKYTTKIHIDKIKLPIKKYQQVGVIDVYQNNKKIKSEKLITTTSARKLTYLQLLIENLKEIPKGVLTAKFVD